MGVETLSVEETAERLGCSRRRVFELLADGVLDRAPRYGRQIRIYEASVDRALAPRRAQRRRNAGPAFTVADLPTRLFE